MSPLCAFPISATTREPRPGETNGVDYHFRSVDQFHQMIDHDDFLEWAKVFKNFYGTPRSEVESRLVSGMDVVFDVDWQGARALKTIRPGDVVWFAAGERHWHGAAPDATMTHIAVHAALDGSTVDWEGPVADADYLSGLAS